MEETLTQTKTEQQTFSSSKKAAMIIAFQDFRDQEYFVPREILEKAGMEVATVSTSEGTARGADGGETEVDLTLSNLDVDDFDAIIFIGGPGALKHLDNEESYQIARLAVQKKVLAAICIAPAILAKAGVLKGKRATVWSSEMDKGPIQTLNQHGADYQDQPVVSDGNIITANGPAAAGEFAEQILNALAK